MSQLVAMEREVIAAYEREYKDLVETWQHVERKAQGVVSIAAIFLGAAFAFSESIASPGREGVTGLLIVNVLVLVLVVVLALGTLWVRSIVSLPVGAELARQLDELDDELNEQRVRGFYYDLRTSWQESVASIQRVTDRKATLLLVSQVVLLVALVLSSALTIRILD